MLEFLLTGGALPAMLLGCGLFFLVYLKGAPLRSPKRMWRAMRAPAPSGGTSPWRAVMLALAGTLGVGNIVGVANAVFIGGAGAVLWIWVSALVAMILKYAEIVLAVAHRRAGRRGFFGGAYYYIKDHFFSRGYVRIGTVLSGLFAVLLLVNALSMGCVVQVNAVCRAAEGVVGVPVLACGIALVLLTLPVLLRGQTGISALTEVLVPAMSLCYILLSLAVLVIKRELLGEVFEWIVRDAFSPASVGGGIIGFLTASALRTGTMRGLLSNEAGCGTAPSAHASANAHSPAAQGVWGIFEVFADTVVLCTLTALVILVSYPEVEMLGHDPVMMTVRAFSSVLGRWSEWLLCAAIFCFGYATVLCWSGYGMESLSFLCRRRGLQGAYILACGACILVGACIAPDSVWTLTDACITALTTVNLLMLLLMRRRIRSETELFMREVL